MEAPDFDMIINIIFFLLVAAFLVVAAQMIMDRAEPKVVISTAFIPPVFSRFRGKKGFEQLTISLTVAVIVIFVLLATFQLITGGLSGVSGGIASILPDLIPFT